MLNILKISAAFITVLLTCQVASANAGVAVIGNPKDGIAALTEKQVKDIYLGKSGRLPGGPAVKIVDLGDDSAVKVEFYNKVIGKNLSQIKAHWAKQVFTGKGTSPASLEDDNAVKKWVTAKPGRIGYISDISVDDTVKVLLQVP